MFHTFSSLAVGFAKYTFEKGFSFALKDAIEASISVAKLNRMMQPLASIKFFLIWFPTL